MIETSRTEPVEILLVEDNAADARLTLEALRAAKLRNNLVVVADGAQALAYLRREGEFAGAVRPDIIFLDLNLPRVDGREVLAEIKQDQELRTIPVVVLTSSSAERDIVETYNLHANCYVTKPVDLQQFMTVVQAIEHFWFEVVKLPGEG